MKSPLFSVIIPSYNRAGFLKIAVESVLRQSLEDFELIIVDDGSIDDTAYLINNIYDKRVIYVKQPHRGVSSARNKGIEIAKGEMIAFLDSDDRFVTDKLEIFARYAEDFPGFNIFHSEEIWYRNNSLLGQKAYHKKPDGQVFNRALKLCCISISTACLRKEIFKEVGTFDENMPACEDYDFWLRAAVRHRVKLIPEALTIKQGGHPDQQSKKIPAMDRLRIYAIDKLLGSDLLDAKQKTDAAGELIKKCGIYIKGAAKRNKDDEVKYYTNLINKYGN